MSAKTNLQLQFAYHGAIYNQLLDCAERLSVAEHQAHPGYGLGSIHDILFHVLYWEHNWRQGMVQIKRPRYLTADKFPTLQHLREGIAAEQAEWGRVIDGMSDADLTGEVVIGGTTFLRWRILQHLVIHGMQHHSEVAALLTAMGQSPGGIDFIWYTPD